MSTDVPIPDRAPPTAAALPPLPTEVPVLQAMIRELVAALREVQQDRDGLQQRLDQLLRRLYGPKAERFDPHQPWLLPEMAPDAAPPAEASPAPTEVEPAPPPRRPGHGRKPLPPDLPRRRCEHTLPEAQRLCPSCGAVCQKFGEDTSEQLDYQPASVFVWQHVRAKYACQQCHDHVTSAPAPAAVIDKGVPGPGLLAQIVASKYADHLPLHRLERILGRHGVTLARSTMCQWMAHVAGLLQPIVDVMAALVRQSKALHTDATKLPFLDPLAPGQAQSGQMWVYYGDRDHPLTVFDFWPDHAAGGIDA